MLDMMGILDDKRDQILSARNPLLVDFTLNEINVLGDINQLRKLKITETFPDNFEQSPDLFSCANKVLEGDKDTYRILEFCVLKNRVLSEPVSRVFKGLVK